MLPTGQISEQVVDNILNKLNVEIQQLGVQHFQNTTATKRRTFSFGYDYFALSNGDKTFIAIPEYIQELCQSCIDSFGPNRNLGSAKNYLNVIISIYEKGYQLEPHVDVDEDTQLTDGKPVDFHFGKSLMGVILQPDDHGRFYVLEAEDENNLAAGKKVFELDEKKGTAFLIEGALRSQPFYHGVSEVSKLRISVTFRTVEFR